MPSGCAAARRRPTKDDDTRIARQLTWTKGVGIGAAQALALIPGFSRSGASMAGGLLAGLSNEDSARFAFLLATPIIGAAALLKLPELAGPDGNGVPGPGTCGRACRRGQRLLQHQVLDEVLRDEDVDPFAVYCLVLGVLVSIGFALS